MRNAFLDWKYARFRVKSYDSKLKVATVHYWRLRITALQRFSGMAILYQDKAGLACARRLFEVWRIRNRNIIGKLADASIEAHQRLQKLMMKRWKQSINNIRLMEVRVDCWLALFLLKRYYSRMAQTFQHVKEAKKQKLLSDISNQSKIAQLRRFFKIWHHTSLARLNLYQLEVKFITMRLSVDRKVFKMWRARLGYIRGKSRLAIAQSRFCLFSHHLHIWRSRYSDYIAELVITTKIMSNYRRGLLSFALRSMHHFIQRMKQLKSRAAEWASKRLKSKLCANFSNWRTAIQNNHLDIVERIFHIKSRKFQTPYIFQRWRQCHLERIADRFYYRLNLFKRLAHWWSRFLAALEQSRSSDLYSAMIQGLALRKWLLLYRAKQVSNFPLDSTLLATSASHFVTVAPVVPASHFQRYNNRLRILFTTQVHIPLDISPKKGISFRDSLNSLRSSAARASASVRGSSQISPQRITSSKVPLNMSLQNLSLMPISPILAPKDIYQKANNGGESNSMKTESTPLHIDSLAAIISKPSVQARNSILDSLILICQQQAFLKWQKRLHSRQRTMMHAADLSSLILLQRYVLKWRHAMKAIGIMKSIAHSTRARSRLLSAFTLWRIKVSLRAQILQNLLKFGHLRDRNIARSTIDRLKAAANASSIKREIIYRKQSRHLIGKCFVRWKEIARLKISKKQLAIQHSRRRVTEISFKFWLNAYSVMISSKAKSFQTKTHCFMEWFGKYKSKSRLRLSKKLHRLKSVIPVYRNNQKVKYFLAWKAEFESRDKLRLLANSFFGKLKIGQQKRALHIWVQQCENFRKADRYRCNRIVCSAFKDWHRKTLTVKRSTVFKIGVKARAKKKYFIRWVILRRVIAALRLRQSVVFKNWRRAAKLRLILKRRSVKCIKLYWKKWSIILKEKRVNHGMTLKVSFTAWREWTRSQLAATKTLNNRRSMINFSIWKLKTFQIYGMLCLT